MSTEVPLSQTGREWNGREHPSAPRRHLHESYPRSHPTAMNGHQAGPYTLATSTPSTATHNTTFPTMSLVPYPVTAHPPPSHHHHHHHGPASPPPPHSYGSHQYAYVAPRVSYVAPKWDAAHVTPDRDTFRGGSCTCKKSK